MKTNFFFLILILFVLFHSCKNDRNEKLESSENIISNKEESKQKVVSEDCNADHSELAKFIFGTDKDVDILEDPKLDKQEAFFFNNANKYSDDTLVLIECENLSENQKGVLLKTMNGLSYKEYINFIDECYKSYSNGYISAFNFEHSVLFNGWGKKHYVAKYYKNDKVVTLLNKILKDNTLLNENPLLKKRIEETLSGEYWERRKAFYTSDAIMDAKALEGW